MHRLTADGSILKCILINITFIIIQSVSTHFWGHLIYVHMCAYISMHMYICVGVYQDSSDLFFGNCHF